VLPSLVGLGISELAVPLGWRKESDWKRLHQRSTRRFLVERDVNLFDSRGNELRLPRTTCLLDGESVPEIDDALINIERPFHIICSTDDAIDRRFRRLFFDRVPHITFNELVRRLGTV